MRGEAVHVSASPRFPFQAPAAAIDRNTWHLQLAGASPAGELGCGGGRADLLGRWGVFLQQHGFLPFCRGLRENPQGEAADYR